MATPAAQLLLHIRRLVTRAAAAAAPDAALPDRFVDGLEIIGVSLDQDAETVRKASKEHGMTWPQVLVPVEKKARQLWQEQVDAVTDYCPGGLARSIAAPGEVIRCATLTPRVRKFLEYFLKIRMLSGRLAGNIR
jgi:hypothetical protein